MIETAANNTVHKSRSAASPHRVPASPFRPDVRAQVRYPRNIFDIQIALYAKYHQTDPKVFYQQEDNGDVGVPKLISEKQRAALSYYLTLDMIERNRFDFVLVSPLDRCKQWERYRPASGKRF
jgi:uncharacterized membrane protein (UPF0182 family)